MTTESRERVRSSLFNRKEFLIAVTSAEHTILQSEITITDSWGVEGKRFVERL
jgi:hypothetical protein